LLLLLILVVGVYLRAVAVVDSQVKRPIQHDAVDYWAYAFNLSHHKVYSRQLSWGSGVTPPAPDAVRPPGYPAVVAGVMRVLPVDGWYRGVLWLQVILGTLSILLTYWLFRAVLPPFWSLVPALLTAISPHLVSFGTYVLTETLFTFVLLVLFVLIRQIDLTVNGGKAWLTGVATGVVTLVRPSFEFFIAPLTLLVATRAPRYSRTRVCAGLLIGFLLIYGAWGLRNLATVGAWSDNSLQTKFLHHGIYPAFMYRDNPASYGLPYRFDPDAGRIEKDTSTVLTEVVRRFRDEPARHLQWFLIGKPVSFWSWTLVQGVEGIFVYPVARSPYRTNPVFTTTARAMLVLHWPLVVLALAGTLLCWLPSARRLMKDDQLFVTRSISLLLVYYTAVHMIGVPFPRYAVPLRPFLYGMATLACWMVYCSVRRPDLGKSINSTPPG